MRLEEENQHRDHCRAESEDAVERKEDATRAYPCSLVTEVREEQTVLLRLAAEYLNIQEEEQQRQSFRDEDKDESSHHAG